LQTKKKIARILVSGLGMPSKSLGSWTQILEYLFGQYIENKIDFLLCGPTDLPFVSVATTRIICKSLRWDFVRKWYYPFKYRSYIKALERIMSSHDYIVVAVIDNIKLKNIVTDTIDRNGWQNKCRVIFMQTGFSYDLATDVYKDFAKGLHEIILLTQTSYYSEKERYNEYPFLINVLHNPIRNDIFYMLPAESKILLKQQLGIITTEKMFLWVSHDRPKKGLDIMLMMWPIVVAKHPGAQLVVIGAKRDIVLPGLRFEGRLPNTEIAKFYQAADVFLFSSLCKEGFGLSLAEAMSCGCFCLASDVGGVNEFFNEKYGIIVTKPNYTQAWVDAIDAYYENPKKIEYSSQPIFLTYDEWCYRFQEIISTSIQFLIQSANR